MGIQVPARGSQLDKTRHWPVLIWLVEPFRNNHPVKGVPALWQTWWLEVSACPISALCLVVRRGSPASSSLLKELLFLRLPLTLIFSENESLAF